MPQCSRGVYKDQPFPSDATEIYSADWGQIRHACNSSPLNVFGVTNGARWENIRILKEQKYIKSVFFLFLRMLCHSPNEIRFIDVVNSTSAHLIISVVSQKASLFLTWHPTTQWPTSSPAFFITLQKKPENSYGTVNADIFLHCVLWLQSLVIRCCFHSIFHSDIMFMLADFYLEEGLIFHWSGRCCPEELVFSLIHIH